MWQASERPAADELPQLPGQLLAAIPHGVRAEEVERHNTDVKNRRQAFKRKFTDPGEPGHMFRFGPKP